MRGIAKGKLLLFGEHAAVYGYPALGLALPWQMKIALVPEGEPFIPAWKEVFPELHECDTLGLNIHSEIPVGVGFGSSAALCVATAQAVCRYFKKETSPEVIWRYAHQLEKQFHQSPSGIDTGLSLYGMPACLRRNAEGFLDHFPMPPYPVALVIGALPRKNSTAQLISRVKSHGDKDVLLARLGEISEAAYTAWSNAAELGSLATQAQGVLKSLGVSTVVLDQLLQEALRLGALGGKLSGAGGGGAYYLIAPSAQDGIILVNQLKAYLLKEKCQSVVEPQLFVDMTPFQC